MTVPFELRIEVNNEYQIIENALKFNGEITKIGRSWNIIKQYIDDLESYVVELRKKYSAAVDNVSGSSARIMELEENIIGLNQQFLKLRDEYYMILSNKDDLNITISNLTIEEDSSKLNRNIRKKITTIVEKILAKKFTEAENTFQKILRGEIGRSSL